MGKGWLRNDNIRSIMYSRRTWDSIVVRYYTSNDLFNYMMKMIGMVGAGFLLNT